MCLMLMVFVAGYIYMYIPPCPLPSILHYSIINNTPTPNTLTVVFMMLMPWVRMELAMCRMLMVLRCLLLDINTPPPNTLTVVFMMPMPCVRMELAMCLTLRCLLLDIKTPSPQHTDRGVHDADAMRAYGVGDVPDVDGVDVLGACRWLYIPLPSIYPLPSILHYSTTNAPTPN